MSGNMLYPDSNFDSDQNYASFNLHFEKNYLEKIPGLTDTKLTHVWRKDNKKGGKMIINAMLAYVS